MKQVAVIAKVPAKDGKPELGPCTVAVNYAETLEEAKEMFGEDAILSNALANWRVTVQGNIRSKLRSGLDCEQIQTALADAKMGVASQGVAVDPQQAFIAKFKMSDPGEQAKMLKMLRAAAQSE